VPSRFGAESFDVGMDNGSPVSENYQPPFAYTGIIKKVEIKIQPSALKASDKRKIRDEQVAAAMVIE
jgi:arylsulfatase